MRLNIADVFEDGYGNQQKFAQPTPLTRFPQEHLDLSVTQGPVSNAVNLASVQLAVNLVDDSLAITADQMLGVSRTTPALVWAVQEGASASIGPIQVPYDNAQDSLSSVSRVTTVPMSETSYSSVVIVQAPSGAFLQKGSVAAQVDPKPSQHGSGSVGPKPAQIGVLSAQGFGSQDPTIQLAPKPLHVGLAPDLGLVARDLDAQVPFEPL